MRPTVIQDEREVIQWLEEGRTFKWMAEEYLRKYNLKVAAGHVQRLPVPHGSAYPRRANDDLVPWAVAEHHRWANPVMMLRAEARRRAGLSVTTPRLDSWVAGLKRDGLVVHYDPDTDEGFFYVPARPVSTPT